jgi:hypothetical protein
VANFNVDPKHRQYTSVYKLFSFSLYSMASVAYDFLRRFIPVHWAKLLRKEFGNDVKEHASELCDIDAFAHIIARQSLPAGIPCTFGVDAFSVDILNPNHPPNGEEQDLRGSAAYRSGIRSV